MDHKEIMWQNIISCLNGYYDHQRREDQLAILNGMILFLESELTNVENSVSSIAETEVLKELKKKYESLDFSSE